MATIIFKASAPKPDVQFVHTDAQAVGKLQLIASQWVQAVQQFLTSFTNGGYINIGTLTNAANDGAAAAAGVPVGALYRNGSVVQIRVT